MRKIVLLIDNLGSGGAQNQMCLLAKGLIKRAYDIELVYYQEDNFFINSLKQNQIPFKLIKKSSKYDLRFLFKLKKYIKRRRKDTIISFLRTPNIINILLKVFTGTHISSIISYRSHTEIEKLSSLEAHIHKFINKRADRIVSNSIHEKENWINHFPELQNKFSHIYNAVDETQFSSGSQEVKRMAKLLVIGSISPMKNGMLVLEALKNLKESGYSPVKVNWYGRIDDNIDSRKAYADRMMTYVKENSLDEWIQFYKPVTDPKALYDQHDALILASLIEGLPNVVCESLSCATPVLLSDGLDHKRIISNDKEGFLFDASNPSQLALQIKKLYKISDIEYKNMCVAAKNRAKALFDYEAFIDSYIQLIDRL